MNLEECDCRTCKGSGKVDDWSGLYIDRGWNRRQKPCKACDGTGYSEAFRKLLKAQ